MCHKWVKIPDIYITPEINERATSVPNTSNLPFLVELSNVITQPDPIKTKNPISHQLVILDPLQF